MEKDNRPCLRYSIVILRSTDSRVKGMHERDDGTLCWYIFKCLNCLPTGVSYQGWHKSGMIDSAAALQRRAAHPWVQCTYGTSFTTIRFSPSGALRLVFDVCMCCRLLLLPATREFVHHPFRIAWKLPCLIYAAGRWPQFAHLLSLAQSLFPTFPPIRPANRLLPDSQGWIPDEDDRLCSYSTGTQTTTA